MNTIIISTIVGSILAGFGILKNDTFLLLGAIIISPLGEIITRIGSHLAKLNINGLEKDTKLLALTVVLPIIIGMLFGKFSKTSENKVKHYPMFKDYSAVYIVVAFVLGGYVAYLTVAHNIEKVNVPFVGVAIAITILPPLVDIGFRITHPYLKNSLIWNDIKIVLANMLPSIAGAFLVYKYIV
jgi:uncharacterized membrane protein